MRLGEVLLEMVAMGEVQLRVLAVFVVIELVILAVNPLPDNLQKVGIEEASRYSPLLLVSGDDDH